MSGSAAGWLSSRPSPASLTVVCFTSDLKWQLSVVFSVVRQLHLHTLHCFEWCELQLNSCILTHCVILNGVKCSSNVSAVPVFPLSAARHPRHVLG